jgi:alkylhydroperoxidase/carboxymuconolactone decarboxylase family protein YurZ
MQNPFDIFKSEAPEVSVAFEGLIDSLIKLDGLDAKTKQLIYIGIKASQKDKLALKFHVPMAKKLGATRKEIRDAILLTLTTNGLKGVMDCLPEALAVYDSAKKQN